MLGPCYPIAQAALGALARPLRYVVHRIALRGAGHHAHHLTAHAGLSGTAAPHAGAMPLMCAQAPGGLLPIGPIPGAYGPAYTSGVGSVGNGAITGSGFSTAIGSGAASGGGLLGEGSLAGGIGALATATLLASGLAVTALSAATTASYQLEAQQAAVADTVQPLPFMAESSLSLLGASASAMMPVSLGAPDMAPGANASGAGTLGAATHGTAASGDAALSARGAFEAVAADFQTNVPEPASLALLGVGIAASWAARRRPSRR